MRITLLAYGSRGDVQPYIALGLGLQHAGYTVCLAAPEMYRDFVAAYGLDFSPLAGDPTRLMAEAVAKAGAGANPAQIIRVILQYSIPIAAQVARDARTACQGADAVIHSMLMCLTGHQLASQMGIPEISALPFPVFAPTPAFPNPIFPEIRGRYQGWYNRKTHIHFDLMFWRASQLAYAWVRHSHPDLPRLVGWPFQEFGGEPVPILYGFSKHVLPHAAGWDFKAQVTGYWMLGEPPGWQPPEDLLDFLDSGPAPVFIGFGSVINRKAGQLAQVAVEAVQKAGCRAVLLTGWGGLEPRSLPPQVFPVEDIPFSWLFPRVKAAIHHGGTGTLAAALHAGIPSVVVPFTADQPFWAKRAHLLGTAPAPIHPRQLTSETLARAIQRTQEDPSI